MTANTGRYDAERVISNALSEFSYECDCYGCPGSASASEVAVRALLDQPAVLSDLLAITTEGQSRWASA